MEATLIREVEMTEEEYIQFELHSDIRHEYLNGKLIDMPGEADFNNEIAQAILFLFRRFFRPLGYKCYMQDIKIKTPGERKYFYPDVFVTKEQTGVGKYVKAQPEIIVEVLSKRTRKYDTVDKFIYYQQFDSLRYYLTIEPDFTLVNLYSRTADGTDWEMEPFTDINGTIPLSSYNFTISIREIYEG